MIAHAQTGKIQDRDAVVPEWRKERSKGWLSLSTCTAREEILLSRSHSETLPGAVLSEGIIQEFILRVLEKSLLLFRFRVSLEHHWVLLFLWVRVLIDGPSLI